MILTRYFNYQRGRTIEPPHSLTANLFNFPNLITFTRVLLIIPLTIALASRSFGQFILLAIFFFIGDLLDGLLAHYLEQRTRFGHVFDSFVDKLCALAIFLTTYIFKLVPLGLILSLLLINLIQLFFTWHLVLKQKRTDLPKTYLGGLVVIIFVASIFLDYSWIGLLYLAALITSVNHLYYYLKKLYPNWFLGQYQELSRLLSRLKARYSQQKFMGTAFSYYQDKLRSRKGRQGFKFFTLANVVTFFRILLIFPVLYFYTEHFLLLALVTMGLFIFLDFVDGYIARKSSAETIFGKILDAFADKAMILGFLILWLQEGRLTLELFYLIIFRIVVIFIMAAIIFLFTKSSLPVAYYSLVSVAAILAFIVWQTDFWLFLATILTLQLIINYFYQGFLILIKGGLSWQRFRNLPATKN